METTAGENSTQAGALTGKLSERAMLVSLTIRLWSGRKYDKKVTKEVNVAHGAVANAGRYNKVLLPQDAPSLHALVKLAGEARTYHYAQTLPWGTDGARILPSANWMEYAPAMAAYRKRFEAAIPAFEADYPALVAQAPALLNGMFNPADYPQDVAKLFGFEVRILPLPEAGDFRVALDHEVMAAIRTDIEQQVQASVQAGMADLWRRVYEVAQRMAERLGEPEAVFRDSLVGNVRELCAVLPKLNLTGDVALEAMRGELERELAGYAPEDLREDQGLRAQVARQAEQLAARAAQYAGIFGEA